MKTRRACVLPDNNEALIVCPQFPFRLPSRNPRQTLVNSRTWVFAALISCCFSPPPPPPPPIIQPHQLSPPYPRSCLEAPLPVFLTTLSRCLSAPPGIQSHAAAEAPRGCLSPSFMVPFSPFSVFYFFYFCCSNHRCGKTGMCHYLLAAAVRKPN